MTVRAVPDEFDSDWTPDYAKFPEPVPFDDPDGPRRWLEGFTVDENGVVYQCIRHEDGRYETPVVAVVQFAAGPRPAVEGLEPQR